MLTDIVPPTPDFMPCALSSGVQDSRVHSF